MSRYGVATYGVDLYGPDTVTATDYVTSLTAMSGAFLDGSAGPYRTVTLLWTLPSGSWDKMRLVRSKVGIPVDEQDGVVLSESTSTDPVLQFQDVDLIPSTFYYYAVFVRTTRGDGSYVWFKADAVRGLSVGYRAYNRLMLDRLPAVFKSSDATALQGLTDLIGFKFDSARDRIDALLDVNDPARVPGDMLPALLSQFGLSYEPEIGMHQNRILARNCVSLAQTKGTATGMAGVVSSVTGWGATVQPLRNLLNNTNDSSAHATVGDWVITSANGAIARVASPSIDTDGSFAITTATTANVVAELKGSNSHTHGIPLKGGTTYFVSLALKNEAGFSPTLGGTFLGDADAGGSVGATTSAADPVDGTWTRYTATITPTGRGVVFVPKLTLTGLTTGTTVNMDEIMVGPGSAFTSYETPRLIRIRVDADRINEAVNGGFDVDTNSWTATGGSLDRVTSGTYDGGAGAGRLTASASTFSLQTTAYVDAGYNYIASARLKASSATTNPATISLAFYNVSNVQVGSTITSASSSVTDAGWVRPFVTGEVPATAVYAKVTITFTGASSDVVLIDDVLVERGTRLLDYFDRKQQRDNVTYEGVTSASRLHYYQARVARQARAQALLDQYTPYMGSYTLLFAQPRS